MGGPSRIVSPVIAALLTNMSNPPPTPVPSQWTFVRPVV